MTTFTVVVLVLAAIVEAVLTVVAVTKNLQKIKELRHSYDKISQKLALLKDFEGDLTALQNKEVYNQYHWQLLSNVRADIHRLEIAKSNLAHHLGK